MEMEDRGGTFDIVIPYATLEPVREKLLQMFVGEKLGQDSIWETHLADEVWFSNVKTEAVLDSVKMNLSNVLQWKKGTHIPLEAMAGDPVLIRCGDRKLFSGRVGNKHKRVVVQIEKNYLKEGEDE